MKKIFAIVLASIMVLSLVPASVFAAISNDKGCPSVHTLTTCPSYTKVEVVDPTCADGGQVGYTIYECNKCGQQFLGDFVDELKHVWVSDADSNHKDSTGKCTGTPTKKWEKCSLCGETGAIKCTATKDCKCNGKGKGYNEYKVDHVLTYVSGAGCEKVYNCSSCKKNFWLDSKGKPTQNKAEIGHAWEFTKITVEPEWVNGVANDGMALYTCDECDDTKEVVVLCEHDCVLQEVSKYKAPTCTATGAYGYYQCDKCLAEEYRGADGKPVSKEVLAEIKANGNVIAKVPHTLKDGGTRVPGKCEITGYCTVCKKDATNIGEHLNVVEVYKKPATCLTIGYEALACNQCGENWLEVIPATGHKTIKVTVATASCSVQGQVYELCTNANCELLGNADNLYVHEGKAYPVVKREFTGYDKTKHIIVKQTITEGSCTANGMYITYCQNGCADYPYQVVVEKADGHEYYAAVEARNCLYNGLYNYTITYKCVDCAATYDETKAVNAIPGTFVSEDEAKLYHGVVVKTTTAVRDSKTKEVIYTSVYTDVVGAKPLAKVNTYPASCTTIGYSTYACTNGCSATFIVVDEPIDHVDADGELAGVKAATCSATGNTGYYECVLCKQYFIEVDGEQVVIATKGLTTNKHSATLTPVNQTNCNGDVVSVYYDCTKCDKYFADAEASKSISKPSNIGHVKTTLNAGVTTTCNTDGISKVEFCDVCDRLFITTVTDKVDTTINSATSTAKSEYTEVKFDTIKISTDKDGVMWITFYGVKGEDAATTHNFSLTSAKIEHEGFIKNCDDTHTEHTGKNGCDYTDAIYVHEYCELCGYEYIKDYAPQHIHTNKKGQVLTADCTSSAATDRNCVVCGQSIINVKHVEGHKNSKLVEVSVTGTCVDEGYTYVYCKDCDYKKVTGSLAVDKNNHVGLYGQELNYAQNGYKKLPCSACGYKGEADKMTKKGLELLLSTTVNGVEDGIATYGSIIEVTVSLASLNGVNVWGLDFGLQYDVACLEYKGFAFAEGSSFFGLANDYSEEYTMQGATEASVAEGIVSIVAHADEEHIAIKGSQDLITLSFEVKYNSDIDAQWIYDMGFLFAVGPNACTSDGYKTFPIHVTDENGKAVANTYNGWANEAIVDFVALCDLDGNGELTIADGLEMYKLMTFNEYDAAADVDGDGDVDTEDMRIYYSLLTGAATLEERYGFKKVEETNPNPDSHVQPRN